MKTEKARLDADRTAQPKTRIVHHPPENGCVGPGTPLHGPEYEDKSGARTPLYPIPRPHVIVNGKPDRPGSGRNGTLTGEELHVAWAYDLGKKEGYEEGRREAAEDTCEWLENEVYPGKRGASLSQRIWNRERSFAETRGFRRPGRRERRTPAAVLPAMLRAYERATFDALVTYFKTNDPREETAQQSRARLFHRQCEVIRREAAGVAAGHSDPVDFNNPGGMMVYPERLMVDYKARLDGERPLDAPPLEE